MTSKDDGDQRASDQLHHFNRMRADRAKRNMVLTHSSQTSKAIKFAGVELFRQEVLEETYVEKPIVKPMSDFIPAPQDPTTEPDQLDQVIAAILACLAFTGMLYLAVYTHLNWAAWPLVGAVTAVVYWSYAQRKKSPAQTGRALDKAQNERELKAQQTAKLLEASRDAEEEMVAQILQCKTLTEANAIAAKAAHASTADSTQQTSNEPLYELIERLVREKKNLFAEKLSKHYMELLD